MEKMETTRWLYAPERWPYISTPIPGLGGVLRVEPEDFCVDEIPPVCETVGEEHLWVRIRKRGITTQAVIQAWETHWKLARDTIGHAGLKDRQAVTTQWLSLPARVTSPEGPWPELEGVQVLDAVYRSRKLKAGDLSGNRFTIRVREALPDTQRLVEILAELGRWGVPNYFGPQRFGRDGDNANVGLDRLTRGRKPRGWLEKLQAQAVQSWLFNEWVARRIQSGTFNAVLSGDVATRHDTGGKFIVQEFEAEQARAHAGAISAMGPLFGRKYHEARGLARQEEDELLETLGLVRDLFRVLPGARRPVRFFMQETEWEATSDGFWLRFTLPPGCYATSVLREVTKASAGPVAPKGPHSSHF